MWLVQLPSDTSDIDLEINSLQDKDFSTFDWIDFAHRLIALLFLVGGFLCLVYLLWGGIQYIVSGGQEEKIKKATQTIRNALIGLVIIILSFTVVSLMGRILGYDLIPYLNFQTIINNVNNLAETFS